MNKAYKLDIEEDSFILTFFVKKQSKGRLEEILPLLQIPEEGREPCRQLVDEGELLSLYSFGWLVIEDGKEDTLLSNEEAGFFLSKPGDEESRFEQDLDLILQKTLEFVEKELRSKRSI